MKTREEKIKAAMTGTPRNFAFPRMGMIVCCTNCGTRTLAYHGTVNGYQGVRVGACGRCHGEKADKADVGVIVDEAMLKTIEHVACKALVGTSNDAEHDALVTIFEMIAPAGTPVPEPCDCYADDGEHALDCPQYKAKAVAQ